MVVMCEDDNKSLTSSFSVASWPTMEQNSPKFAAQTCNTDDNDTNLKTQINDDENSEISDNDLYH